MAIRKSKEETFTVNGNQEEYLIKGESAEGRWKKEDVFAKMYGQSGKIII